MQVALVKHNYESGLNGNGRNLMLQMKKEDARIWNSYKGSGSRDDVSDNYDGSEIDSWVNGTWPDSFSATIRNKMGSTSFTTYYTHASYDDEDHKLYHWSEYKTISRKAFLLSVKEVNAFGPKYTLDGDGVPSEGSKLPNIESLYFAVLGNLTSGNWVWSRSRLDYDKSNHYSDWYLDYGLYRNVVFPVNSYQNSYMGTPTDIGIRADEARTDSKFGCLPAFAFPNDVEVDVNGRIML